MLQFDGVMVFEFIVESMDGRDIEEGLAEETAGEDVLDDDGAEDESEAEFGGAEGDRPLCECTHEDDNVEEEGSQIVSLATAKQRSGQVGKKLSREDGS